MIPSSKLVKVNTELKEYCLKRKAEGIIIFQRLTERVLKKTMKTPNPTRKGMISN